jgi:hypothetical protein
MAWQSVIPSPTARPIPRGPRSKGRNATASPSSVATATHTAGRTAERAWANSGPRKGLAYSGWSV